MNFSRPAQPYYRDTIVVRPLETSMSDEAERLFERLLVLRCQTGDEDAYRELVGRSVPGCGTSCASWSARSIGPTISRKKYGSTCCANCRG